MNILQDGDFLYIRGVDKYNSKHLSGSYIGWNLICMVVDGEKRFIGFGPDDFGPNGLSFQEISKLLIDGYNKPQDEKTKKFIHQYLYNESTP